MKIFKTGSSEWTNRHETFTEPLGDLYDLGNDAGASAIQGYNSTTQGLQQLVQQAIDQDTTLRPMGAGWSWTKVMTPASGGILLNTKPLNTLFSACIQDTPATRTNWFLRNAVTGYGSSAVF
jgi:FAD/FMN-containing dehydrogenase